MKLTSILALELIEFYDIADVISVQIDVITTAKMLMSHELFWCVWPRDKYELIELIEEDIKRAH